MGWCTTERAEMSSEDAGRSGGCDGGARYGRCRRTHWNRWF
ncbi:hypothetical protein LG3211_3724 [Lysobacter gummosus]|nr:hypothetical protein LG3211_3724 [Lysobacter gummosus]